MPSADNPFRMDTGSFFRLYSQADEMTRSNLVLGLHLKLHEQSAELARAKTVTIVALALLAATIIGIIIATH